MFYYSYAKDKSRVQILGDKFELDNLYRLIHKIAKPLADKDSMNGQYQLLLYFAYEIDKAASGKRNKDISKYEVQGKIRKNTYYGTSFCWIDLIIIINIIRKYSSFSLLDRHTQAYLYSLESAIENAIISFDEKGDSVAKYVFKIGLDVSGKYL